VLRVVALRLGGGGAASSDDDEFGVLPGFVESTRKSPRRMSVVFESVDRAPAVFVDVGENFRLTESREWRTYRSGANWRVSAPFGAKSWLP
jgi:hypothetical protein